MYIDSMRFTDMFIDRNHGRACEAHSRIFRWTSIGTWQQRWAHWDGRISREACWVGSYTVSPWALSQEGIGYESRLSELCGPHGDASSVSVNVRSLELVKLNSAFDALWFIDGLECWARNLDMGCRCGTAPITHAS